MTATVVDLQERRRSRRARRIPHPSLGPCGKCASEDVRPLHDDSDGGRVVGVWCNQCSWLAPLAEVARARAVVEGAARVGGRGARATMVIFDEAQSLPWGERS